MKRTLYQTGADSAPLASTPQTRYNSPGQSRLAYRVGRYPDLVRDMLRQVHGWTDSASAQRPLARLNLDMPGDLGAAMIKSWAVIGDVLSFYQERIANEGYLATSTEALSAYALSAQIGYRPAPALSASAWLSYTVREAAGAPSMVALAAGPAVTVQSLPAEGELPQTFENDEAIQARVEWNALRLASAPAAGAPQLAPGATLLLLDGVRSTPRPGTRLLMLGQAGGAPGWVLALSGQLEANRAAGCTVLHFTRLACSEHGADAALEALTLLALDQSAALFGHQAAPWQGLPASVKQRYGTRGGGPRLSQDGGASWTAHGAGLADGALRALLVTPDGSVLGAGAGGLWRCAAADLPWTALRTPLRRGFHALRCDRHGNLFAAGDNGALLRSNDGGDSWVQLELSMRTPARRPWSRSGVPVEMQGTLRALAFEADGAGLIAAGDSGVFYNSGGLAWQSSAEGLPGFDAESGLCTEPVLCLWSDPDGGAVWAGTQQGLFCCERIGSAWRPAGGAMPAAVQVSALAGAGQLLLAATDGELWRSDDRGAHWQAVALGAPASAPRVHALLVLPGAAKSVLAGTSIGLLRSDDLGRTWRPSECTWLMRCEAGLAPGLERGWLDPGLLQALAERGVGPADDARVTPLAGGDGWRVTLGDGAPLTIRRGDGDLQVYQELPAARTAVTALAGHGASLAMAMPFEQVLEREWPHFHPAPGQIDLDRVYPGLARGQWLALCQPGGALPFAVAQVAAEERLLRSDFQLSASVSRLTLTCLAPAAPTAQLLNPLGLFNLRDCSVALQGAALALFEPKRRPFAPVLGASIALDATTLSHLFRAQHKISLAGRAASARLAIALGGVAAACGAPARAALAGHDIRVLLARDAGLLAGAADGVFELQAGQWQALGRLTDVRCLQFDAGGTLHAGSAHGLYRWQDGAWQDAGLAAHPVCALALDPDGALLAAIDAGAGVAGIYRNSGPGQWQRGDAGLEGVPSALLGGAGGVYAGTAGHGVYHLAPGEVRWRSMNEGLTSWHINTLAADGHGAIWAGTGQAGLQMLARGRWRHSGAHLARADVRAIHAGPDGSLYAAVYGDAVYRSADRGLSWERHTGPGGNAVRALANDGQGQVMAGCAALCVLEDAGDGRLEIAQSWLATLASTLAPALAQGYLTQDIRAALRSHDVQLGADASLQVDASGTGWLDDGIERQWMLLARHDGVGLYDSPRLHVLAAASPGQAGGAWLLGMRSGRRGALRCLPHQLLLQGAGEDNPQLGEIASIAAAGPGAGGVASLQLDAALRHAYDPEGLRICANVARASHGESVAQEVLGSGNAARPNQQMQLKKGPLTMLATPSGTRSTLQVYVRARSQRSLNPAAAPGAGGPGIAWAQLASLAGAGPRLRGYTAVTDQYGRATLTFGDGRHGARLPSATENVIASYRAGAGVLGNVKAGQLNRLRSRPAGISKVSNASAASGGTDAEPVEQIRRNAPRSISVLGRVVSLGDYAVFARNYAGVAKSAVSEVWTGQRRIIGLTLAGAAGAELDSAMLNGLREAIDANRAFAQPLHLGQYEARPFQLAARVRIADGYGADAVLGAARAALLGAFGFEARALGQALSASDVIAFIQMVPGVLALTLTNFQFPDASHGVYRLLAALPARWDRVHGCMRGAQLLSLSDAALSLTAENNDE